MTALREEVRLKMVACSACDGVGEIVIAPTSKWGDPTPDGIPCSACDGYGFDFEDDAGDDVRSPSHE